VLDHTKPNSNKKRPSAHEPTRVHLREGGGRGLTVPGFCGKHKNSTLGRRGSRGEWETVCTIKLEKKRVGKEKKHQISDVNRSTKPFCTACGGPIGATGCEWVSAGHKAAFFGDKNKTTNCPLAEKKGGGRQDGGRDDESRAQVFVGRISLKGKRVAKPEVASAPLIWQGTGYKGAMNEGDRGPSWPVAGDPWKWHAGPVVLKGTSEINQERIWNGGCRPYGRMKRPSEKEG